MKKYPDKFNEKIIELFNSGLTCYRISRILKCSEYKVRKFLIVSKMFKPKKRNWHIKIYRTLTESDIEADLKTRLYK